MTANEKKLKLGKGSAFVKSRLKRLRQEEEAWEVDFRDWPQSHSQRLHYIGMVVSQSDGGFLAEKEVDSQPDVNDLAALLARAMERPLLHSARRPSMIILRGHRRWKELVPHLNDIGIEVVTERELPQVDSAYTQYLQHMQEPKIPAKPTTEQETVEDLFPVIASWVQDGHVEIGDQEGFGFVARALDYGGQVFETSQCGTLAEAMAALEQGLAQWLKDQKLV